MSDFGAFLARQAATPGVEFPRATVTAVSPLTVLLDGSTTALVGVPYLGAKPAVGDVVLVSLNRGSILVHGTINPG